MSTVTVVEDGKRVTVKNVKVCPICGAQMSRMGNLWRCRKCGMKWRPM